MDDFSALLASPIPMASPHPMPTNPAPEYELQRSPPLSRQQCTFSIATPRSPFSHISPPGSPSLSPSSRQFSSTSRPSTGSCACLENATVVLETVETKMNRVTCTPIDNLLSFQKRVLQDCHAILDCTSCCAKSSLILLLIIISEKLVVSFKKLPSGNNDEWQDLDLGDYKLNSAEERTCVYKALVGLQLGRMKSLLTRLWGATSLEKWETHRNLLKTTYRQFRECCGVTESTGRRA